MTCVLSILAVRYNFNFIGRKHKWISWRILVIDPDFQRVVFRKGEPDNMIHQVLSVDEGENLNVVGESHHFQMLQNFPAKG